MPSNVKLVLYSTKAVFQRATYTTTALRCRIYGWGENVFATRSRSRVSPLNFSSTDGYGTVKLTLRPNIWSCSAKYAGHGFYDVCTYF